MTVDLELPLRGSRPILTPEHEEFRTKVRQFLLAEAVPRFRDWDEKGHPDRAFWRKAGEAGLLRAFMPVEYGGWGKDLRYAAVIREEMAKLGIGGTGLGVMFSADVAGQFIMLFGTATQKSRWLPGIASGEVIAALAMTEPGAGSDVQGITTVAERQGSGWWLSGRKTYITNGHQADLVIVAAQSLPGGRAHGLSLFLVPGNAPGLSKGTPMKKIGLRYEDAAELNFDRVKLSDEDILGTLHEGFKHLMQGMVWERMHIAIMGVAVAEAAIEETIRYVRERKAFGTPLFEFQNTRFTLAECVTETTLGRMFVDHCLDLYCRGSLSPSMAAMAKYWCTDLQGRVVDRCLQLYGGAGYLMDNPLGRAYADARVTRIYGGTNEIMKEIIARAL